MNKIILIIGSGIAGMSCALQAVQNSDNAILVSSMPSERAQSVMAAGGINAVINTNQGDSIALHVEDTMKGGCDIASREAVEGLCRCAPEIISRLEKMGVIFNRRDDGSLDQRAFGGQSRSRTCFAGTCTGKQIVTALSRELRRYEADGRVVRLSNHTFLSALINNDGCHGAVFLDNVSGEVCSKFADSTVFATGGLNTLFGKTTGSIVCDGNATAELFLQGVRLKNLEFIQFHPTTLELSNKNMLISEAARGEGGRLFYEKDGKRVYFMEDLYGKQGNLMTRDVVAREIYRIEAPSSVDPTTTIAAQQVFLDVTGVGDNCIRTRLNEVYERCKLLANLDICKDPIPVRPWVHYFMGGIDVGVDHMTNIPHLFAAGECASIYHGANRLGGNSLLGAFYGGMCAANSASQLPDFASRTRNPTLSYNENFAEFISATKQRIGLCAEAKSRFPVVYIQNEIAKIMNNSAGIIRNATTLRDGIIDLDFFASVTKKLHYNGDISAYQNYSIFGRICLAKACLLSALSRKESRGSHTRVDFPETNPDLRCSTTVVWQNGDINIEFGSSSK